MKIMDKIGTEMKIFLINVIQVTLLFLIFGIKFTKSSIIIGLVFSGALVLLLKQIE